MFIHLFAWLAGLVRYRSRTAAPYDSSWRMRNYLIGIFAFLALECFLIGLSIYLEIYTQATAGDMTRLQTGMPLLVAMLLAGISLCEACCLMPRMMKILKEHRSDIPASLLDPDGAARRGQNDLQGVL